MSCHDVTESFLVLFDTSFPDTDDKYRCLNKTFGFVGDRKQLYCSKQTELCVNRCPYYVRIELLRFLLANCLVQ